MKMILTDAEIIKECEGESPLISPFIDHSVSKVVSHGLSCVGYDVRLGDEFAHMYNSQWLGSIKPPGHKEDFIKIKRRSYRLHPGEFILAHTIETITMPNYLTGFVKDKSTYARLGIAVQNTVLEPGWSGQITLEITNHGPRPVRLKTEEGIAQVIFHKHHPVTNSYEKKGGKYMNQREVVLPR